MLERNHRLRHKASKRFPAVTIAIGILNSNPDKPSVILASDSQTTYGVVKTLVTQKLNIIDFKNDQILIAQAGSAELADKAIEILKEKAIGVSVTSKQTVLDIVEHAVRKVRDHFIQTKKEVEYTDEQWQRFFLEEANFELLIGFIFERKPYLYSIDISWALSIPIKTPYKAIGIGKDLGEFLIREYAQIDQTFEWAYPIAVSVIEKTIDNVDGCGRPCWVGQVFPMIKEASDYYERHGKSYQKSLASIVNQNLTSLIALELKQAELEAANSKKDILKKALMLAAQKQMEEIRQTTDVEFNQ